MKDRSHSLPLAAFLASIPAAILSLTACAPTPKPGAVAPLSISTNRPEVRVHKDTLFWNGRPLVLRQSLDAWREILGHSPRAVDRAGGMWIWDSLGILVKGRYSDSTEARHVAACWLVFQKRDVDFWPRHPFAGTLSIQDSALSDSLGEALSTHGSHSHWVEKKWPWFQGFPQLTSFARLRFTGNAPEDSLQALLFQVYPW